jgi:hypothetical protein
LETFSLKEFFGAGASMYSGVIMKASMLHGRVISFRRQKTGTQEVIIRRPYAIANWMETVKMITFCQLGKVTIAALNTGLKIIGPFTTTSGLKDELFAVNYICNKLFD